MNIFPMEAYLNYYMVSSLSHTLSIYVVIFTTVVFNIPIFHKWRTIRKIDMLKIVGDKRTEELEDCH